MHSMSTLYLSKAWRQGAFWERSHKFCRSSSFKSNGDHRHNRPNIFKDSRKGMPRTISWSTVSCSIFSTRLPVLNGLCSLWPTRDSATSSTCTWAMHGTAWQLANVHYIKSLWHIVTAWRPCDPQLSNLETLFWTQTIPTSLPLQVGSGALRPRYPFRSHQICGSQLPLECRPFVHSISECLDPWRNRTKATKHGHLRKTRTWCETGRRRNDCTMSSWPTAHQSLDWSDLRFLRGPLESGDATHHLNRERLPCGWDAIQHS